MNNLYTWLFWVGTATERDTFVPEEMGTRFFATDTREFHIWTGTIWAKIGPGSGGAVSWGSITGTLSNQNDLQAALNGKAAVSHGHAQSDVTNLVSDLAGKASTSHTHTQAQSHNSPDTDAATTSLHHTIGASATQAAAGNHTHAGGSSELWEGKVHTNMLDGNPMAEPFMAAATSTTISTAVTPTNIGATVGRIVAFRYKSAITVSTIRWYGIGAVSNIYTVAIYRDSDGARLWGPGAISTTAATWGNSTSGLPITLNADTLYWFGISANTTGTTAGFVTPPVPRQQSWGLASPAWAGLTTIGLRYCQVALTAGAWPATLPSKSNAAAWTGFIPMFWFCASGL